VSKILLAVLGLSFGACLAGLGGYSAARDLRTGVIRGRVNNFSRSASPKIYWFGISATIFATVIGLAFFAAGLVLLASQFAE
jgi:hypothetical protein